MTYTKSEEQKDLEQEVEDAELVLSQEIESLKFTTENVEQASIDVIKAKTKLKEFFIEADRLSANPN